MACAGCTIDLKGGEPPGCRSNGNCSTGGCNRLNTYDWLTALNIEDVEPFFVVEVSFKNGSRKGFFYNQPYTRASTGDLVAVETNAGCDVGRVTLSGELVRFQMRKKKVPEDGYFPKVLRIANERDAQKLTEVRNREKDSLVRARAIARTLKLNMKIGDVEYQGDGRKATFYYTADGRVDFRDLIRHFAKEFKVKIEMRQIGARQESARIGGLGPCGRELCCSTWLTSYRTVSTTAARYQNLAINQAKLSGQCGRLKCCLNYELDTYMEALSAFPENADKLKTKMGIASLVKTDIFKGLMYYAYNHESGRGRMYILNLKRVRDIRDMNKRGEFPDDLAEFQVTADTGDAEEHDFADVTGVIELPPEERKGRGKRRSNRTQKRGTRTEKQRDAGSPRAESKSPERKERDPAGRNRGSRNRGRGRGRGQGGNKNRNEDKNRDK
jgi:cell fate regulator YaaT (PSP1 superfamily)